MANHSKRSEYERLVAENALLREYVAFLEKACGQAEVFCSIHGVHTSEEDIAEGKRLRAALAATENSNAD